MLRSRWIHFLSLSWAVLWFALIAPAHERGAVRLPGSSGAVAGSDFSSSVPTIEARGSCCSVVSYAGNDGETPSPRPSQSEGCAICKLMATLSVPPAFSSAPVALGIVDLLDIFAPTDFISRDAWSDLYARGPPVIS